MRRFIEKLIIIVLSLYFSYLDSEIDLVFYLLISLIISMSLDLFAFKKIRYVLYFLFIVLIFYDNIFLYYFPLILYNMYIDFKKTFFLFLPLLFMNLNILIVVLSFIALYLSISTDRLNVILIQNRSVRDKLKEDTLFLRKYNEQLKVDEEKNIQIALLEERNRIARELHDSIGHTISSSIIQLKALKLIKNEDLTNGLDALGKNLSTGMDDIRSNLYNLRNESIDLEYNINEIIDETIGLNINLTYNIDCDLDYKLKYDILAAVKEAINNTLKHSSADSMDIKILNQPKFYSIIINDNGTIYDYKKDSDDGIGLYSMDEMAKKYKGIFNYRFEDGFRLHLTLMKGNKI